jgi:hypothetical protein
MIRNMRPCARLADCMRPDSSPIGTQSFMMLYVLIDGVAMHYIFNKPGILRGLSQLTIGRVMAGVNTASRCQDARYSIRVLYLLAVMYCMVSNACTSIVADSSRKSVCRALDGERQDWTGTLGTALQSRRSILHHTTINAWQETR